MIVDLCFRFKNESDQAVGQEYILRLYDTDLMEFSMTENGIEGLKADIHWINDSQRALLPLDMEFDNFGVLKWLQRRVIPKNRACVSEILRTFGLSMNDVKGIIDVCKALSLNDSYWVVPQGFAGKYTQYNLYENRFFGSPFSCSLYRCRSEQCSIYNVAGIDHKWYAAKSVAFYRGRGHLSV